jgi:hypothetical protein
MIHSCIFLCVLYYDARLHAHQVERLVYTKFNFYLSWHTSVQDAREQACESICIQGGASDKKMGKSVYEKLISAVHQTLFRMKTPLKTKRRLLYLKTQSVPRSEHYLARL